jgi:molecular chaperone DnaK
VARVVLVGGPTLMPGAARAHRRAVRRRIAAGIDPMTIVARGAALYAGSVGLDATPPRARRAGAGPRGAHRAPVGDRRPGTVRRRPLPARAGQALPDRVRIEREDGGRSAALWIGERRRRALGRGELRPPGAPGAERRNRFRVRAFDRAGAEVALATPAFAIVHGVSIGDPPLARAIGVARADDSTHVYFAKGRRCRRAGRSRTTP